MKLNRPARASIGAWLMWMGTTVQAQTAPAEPLPPIVWQSVSQATDRWLWMALYDATLERTAGTLGASWSAEGVPLRLTLCYRRSIKREWLIEAAQTHLPDALSAPLQAAVEGLHERYRDVAAGDCYRLTHLPDGRTQLALNGTLQFETRTPGFKALYFGLWLGDEPLSVALKEALTRNL